MMILDSSELVDTPVARVWRVGSSYGNRIVETVKLRRNGEITCTCSRWDAYKECSHILYLRLVKAITEPRYATILDKLRVIREIRSWDIEEDLHFSNEIKPLIHRVEERNGRFTCTCPGLPTKNGHVKGYCIHIRKARGIVLYGPQEEENLPTRRIRMK